jgi:hypothetical protein
MVRAGPLLWRQVPSGFQSVATHEVSWEVAARALDSVESSWVISETADRIFYVTDRTFTFVQAVPVHRVSLLLNTSGQNRRFLLSH